MREKVKWIMKWNIGKQNNRWELGNDAKIACITHFYQNERDCDWDGNRQSKNDENGHICIG